MEKKKKYRIWIYLNDHQEKDKRKNKDKSKQMSESALGKKINLEAWTGMSKDGSKVMDAHIMNVDLNCVASREHA